MYVTAGVHGRCSVVLINDGVVVESGDITVSFGLTAPAGINSAALTFVCNLVLNDDTGDIILERRSCESF